MPVAPRTSPSSPVGGPGLVVAAFRRHYSVELDGGGTLDCVQKGRSLQLACGDRVRVHAVAGGGAIDAVESRTSLFYRSDAFKEKLIAANVTQVIGVVAPDVAIDEHLLNRWIIGAQAERCRFVLVANKSDLPGFDALRARLAPYAALGYVVVALHARRDADALRTWLEGQHSVLIGQSGMGKSTILNAVAPGTAARTSAVSEALRAGRHTTSSTTLYRLDPHSWIVDSPGMSVFGLAHYPPDVLEHAFVELHGLVGRCRFNDCRHDREPDCAVRAAVEAGTVAPQRLALLHALLDESHAARDPAR